jgi:diguanylate cyclase (GGDEF)-like protein
MKNGDLDEVTGVFSYSYLVRRLEEEVKRSKRYNHHFSLLLIDIDNLGRLKELKDFFLADYVLREVARILRENLREVDIIGRGGSAKFAIILPEIGAENAFPIGERIRAAVERASFKREDVKYSVPITLSVGISTYPESGKDHLELCKKATQALRYAKACGGNKVK